MFWEGFVLELICFGRGLSVGLICRVGLSVGLICRGGLSVGLICHGGKLSWGRFGLTYT